jgi:HD-like signal output (HDOD) protein
MSCHAELFSEEMPVRRLDSWWGKSMKSVLKPNDAQASVTGFVPCFSQEKIIRFVGDLPAMPHIAAQIMQKLASSDSTPQEIHELITNDQSLAARVLKIANSPYYGASRSISSIKEAIIFMGFDSISSLIMTAVMKDMFSTVSDAGRRMWEHSICCAVAAKHIGGALGLQSLEEAFLAGLMHDIGKSVLFLQVPDKMRDVVLLVSGGKSFWDSERELLGFTHAEVGRLLTQKWRFTLTMEEVVANHHEPDYVGSARQLAHIVSLANSLCHKLSLGLTMRPAIDPYELESTKALGLGAPVISRTLKLLAETETVSSAEKGEQ